MEYYCFTDASMKTPINPDVFLAQSLSLLLKHPKYVRQFQRQAGVLARDPTLAPLLDSYEKISDNEFSFIFSIEVWRTIKRYKINVIITEYALNFYRIIAL